MPEKYGSGPFYGGGSWTPPADHPWRQPWERGEPQGSGCGHYACGGTTRPVGKLWALHDGRWIRDLHGEPVWTVNYELAKQLLEELEGEVAEGKLTRKAASAVFRETVYFRNYNPISFYGPDKAYRLQKGPYDCPGCRQPACVGADGTVYPHNDARPRWEGKCRFSLSKLLKVP